MILARYYKDTYKTNKARIVIFGFIVISILAIPLPSSQINCNDRATIYIYNPNPNSPNSPSLAQQSPNSPQQSSNSEMSFTPSEICIKTNGAVTWINNDTTLHTVSSGNFVNGSTNQFISPILSQSQDFKYVFTAPGNFTYYDPMHPNMNGTIQVKPN